MKGAQKFCFKTCSHGCKRKREDHPGQVVRKRTKAEMKAEALRHQAYQEMKRQDHDESLGESTTKL